MVDELELLRKDWQKQEQSLPHFSKEELYPMLLKKSSSIVKWILIVSVFEFGLWLILTFGIQIKNDQIKSVENAIGKDFEMMLDGIHIFALVFFLGWFLMNYRKIKNTDSPITLMKNIINTRKTVKFYIWFNILFLIISTIFTFLLISSNSPSTFESNNLFIALIILISFLGFVVSLLFLFYKLLYGKLLKRLENNYKELINMKF